MHSFLDPVGPRGGREPVFWAFAAGGLLALVVMSLLPRLLFGIVSPKLPFLRPLLPALLLLGQFAAFFADGALGAFLLGLRPRGRLGFGLAFLGTGYLLERTFFFIRFLPAALGPVQAWAYPAGMFGLGFGIAGFAGSLVSGFSPRSALRISGISGLAGVAGGTVLILPFLLAVPAGAARLDSLLNTSGTLAGFLIPHLGLGMAVRGFLPAGRSTPGSPGGR